MMLLNDEVMDMVRRVIIGCDERRLTLSTAESCTGGLIGGALTALPGASRVFIGGVISYSNDVKAHCLGVPVELLVQHGAVSEPVAQAMAEGARMRLQSDLAVAVTGIAGPDGGSALKPVGLVYTALAYKGGTCVLRNVFTGDRDAVRMMTVRRVCEMILTHLEY